MTTFGRQRQTKIYLDGLAGKKTIVPIHPIALEHKACRSMSKAAFAYIAGGAGTESTMEANQRAFDRWRIVPRMMVDVSHCDMGIELFGQKLSSPLLLAPIGVLEMAHRDADLAVAKAATAEHVPMIFSGQASKPMETCAAVMGECVHWFQLYWSQSDDLTLSFVARAEACGCSAIVITLDTTMLGWRTRDLDLAYLPFLRGKGIAQYISDPVFQAQIAQHASDETAETSARFSLPLLRVLWELSRSYPGT